MMIREKRISFAGKQSFTPACALTQDMKENAELNQKRRHAADQPACFLPLMSLYTQSRSRAPNIDVIHPEL